MRQLQIMVEAAKRLIARNGSSFTTQELAREAGVAVQRGIRAGRGVSRAGLAVAAGLAARPGTAVAGHDAYRAVPRGF